MSSIHLTFSHLYHVLCPQVKQAERSEAPVAAAMPFPFGKSHKSPADIVKNLKESMAVLEKQDISDKKAEKVCIWLYFIFLIFWLGANVRQVMRWFLKISKSQFGFIWGF